MSLSQRHTGHCVIQQVVILALVPHHHWTQNHTVIPNSSSRQSSTPSPFLSPCSVTLIYSITRSLSLHQELNIPSGINGVLRPYLALSISYFSQSHLISFSYCLFISLSEHKAVSRRRDCRRAINQVFLLHISLQSKLFD